MPPFEKEVRNVLKGTSKDIPIARLVLETQLVGFGFTWSEINQMKDEDVLKRYMIIKELNRAEEEKMKEVQDRSTPKDMRRKFHGR